MNEKYSGKNPAIAMVGELRGREDIFKQLDDHVKHRRSVVLMGVEGVGKSSVLNCYFNVSYRRKTAIENNILIKVTDFPADRDSDGVYNYLTEEVCSAVKMLNQEETQTTYLTLKKACEEQKNDCTDAASRFQQVCEVIQDEGYFIMLVIDHFERFVSSPHVKMEHHNLMNMLISKNLSFVVATNFDFNQDSLPETISGSFLLMKFSSNEVKLKGLGKEACKETLDEGDFSEEELQQMWILSGGIPSVFRIAAKHTYAYKQDGEIVWMDILQKTYQEVLPELAHWCRLLSANQVRVLKMLVESDSKIGMSFEEDALEIAAKQLEYRGLLVNPIEAGTYRKIEGVYKFNSPLLKLYCKKNVLQEESITSFQAEQEEVQVIEELASTIENEEADEDEIIEMYRKIALVRGLPMPVDFTQEVSENDLQEFELTQENINRFDERVQKFILNGIMTERTFVGVKMFDYSPSYLSFAKAVELHLNLTLVPILRKIVPNESLNINGRMVKLKDTDHLMLGSIKYILNRSYSGTGNTFISKAGEFSKDNLNNRFPETWWRKIRDDFELIHVTRNDMPHTDFFSGNEGKNFLKKMFSGEKCFLLRCQNLYDTAIEKNVIHG